MTEREKTVNEFNDYINTLFQKVEERGEEGSFKGRERGKSSFNDISTIKSFLGSLTLEEVLMLATKYVDGLVLNNHSSKDKMTGNQVDVCVSSIIKNYKIEQTSSMLVANLNQISEAKKEIPIILAKENIVKAAILVYLHKHKTIYVRLAARLFLEGGSYYKYGAALENLEKKGFVSRNNGVETPFSKRQRKLEASIRRGGQPPVWFNITPFGEALIEGHQKELSSKLPPKIRQRALIKDPRELFKVSTTREMRVAARDKEQAELVEAITAICAITNKQELAWQYQHRITTEATKKRRKPSVVANEWLERARNGEDLLAQRDGGVSKQYAEE